MKGVAIISPKGGVGKTSLSHLLALGAAWRGMPAYVFHTDERDPLIVNERPYEYIDARDSDRLETVIDALVQSKGISVIDGGGNRPHFDQWISEYMDLVLIPVTPDTEAITLGMRLMDELQRAGVSHARYLLSMTSSNAKALQFDQTHFYSRLPQNLIAGSIPRVESVRRLGMPDHEPFPTPPTPVNNASRKLYRIVLDTLAQLEEGRAAVTSAETNTATEELVAS